MKGKEIIDYTVKGKMPDLEQVRENCHNQAADIVSAGYNVEKKRLLFKPSKIFVTTAVFVLMIMTAVTVAAIINSKYLKPSDVLNDKDGYGALSAAFESETAVNINESVISGDYIFTLLSIVSGKGLQNEFNYSFGVYDERTYAVIAIENADGTPFPDDFSESIIGMGLYASPFVKGLKPWLYNVATLSGMVRGFIENGIMYGLYECDAIEMFADRGLYFVICGGGAIYDYDAIIYDEETGEIKANPDYDGPCAVFELPIDKSRGNPEKAEAYLHSIDYYWNPPEIEIDENPGIEIGENNDNVKEHTINANDFIMPSTFEEYYALMRTEHRNKFMKSLDWDNAIPVEGSFKEVIKDENGILDYPWVVYDENGDIIDGGGKYSFDSLFENNGIAQLDVSGGFNGRLDENGNLKIRQRLLSMDENGKITAVTVELIYPLK